MTKFKLILLICVLIKLNERVEAQTLVPICEGKDIIYNSDVIKLSDVIESLKTTTNENCNWDRLVIFATDKFIVDTNYEKIKAESDLVIMAPEWIVENNFHIELNGNDGKKHKEVRARAGNSFRMESGMNGSKGKDGKDGKPGFPGGCGGSIFSIALKTEKLELLTFTSKGGDGSSGQDGGRGGQGSHGVDSEPGGKDVGAGGIGGKGGTGGKGGFGGYPGTIFFKTKDGKQLEIQKIPGTKGLDGSGAYSGSNGAPGKILPDSNVSGSSKFGAGVGEAILIKIGARKATTTARVKRVSRKKSLDGANTINLQAPEKCAFGNQAAILNKYKSFALKGLTNESFSEKLNLFLKYLNELSAENKFYDAVGYVNELRILDEHLFYVKNRNFLLPLYESLLNRLAADEDIIPADKDIINSPLLMKRLKNHISEVINYSNDAARNLDIDSSLKILTDKNKEFISIKDTIETAKDISAYKNDINQAIYQGVNYIDGTLMPSIENINEDIENYIDDNVIDEIIRNEQKIKNDNAKLAELMPKAAIASALKIAASFCKMVGAVFTTSGGFGLAAVAVGSVATYSSNALFDVSEVNNLIAKQATDLENVESRLLSIKTFINDMNNEKAEVFEKQLMSLPDDKQILINRKFKDLKEGSDKYEALQKLVKSDGKNYFDKKTLIEVTAYATVAETSMEIFNELKNNANNMEAMSDMITAQKEHLEKIYELRDFVNNDLMDIVKSITTVIGDNLSAVKEKNHIGLQITEIKVNESLQKFKRILGSISGPETNDGLANLLQNMLDSYENMFKIYHLIANENKDKKVADLIAKLPNIYNLTDSNLVLDAINLDGVIEANKILEIYKPVSYNIMQYVFPFSGESYTQKFMLSPSVSLIYLANIASSNLPEINAVYNQYHNKYATEFTYTNINYKFEFTKDMAADRLNKREIVIKTNTSYNALKFDKIILNIVINKGTKNERSLSDFFDIELEHMENSFYKCGNYQFAMPNAHKVFQLTPDQVWKTTQLSSYLLSPVALWKVKLSGGKKKQNYKNFPISQMTVELSGTGKYLKKESTGICNQLADYRPYRYKTVKKNKK